LSIPILIRIKISVPTIGILIISIPIVGIDRLDIPHLRYTYNERTQNKYTYCEHTGMSPSGNCKLARVLEVAEFFTELHHGLEHRLAAVLLLDPIDLLAQDFAR
jgi:hypothetical protein